MEKLLTQPCKLLSLTFCLVILLLLAAGCATAPQITDRTIHSMPPQQLSIGALRDDKVVFLGSTRTLRVYVSLEAIDERYYLKYIYRDHNALVITHFAKYAFIDPELSISKYDLGALGRAVVDKLKISSLNNLELFYNKLQEVGEFEPGDVLHIALDETLLSNRIFPVQDIFVILFETGSHEDEKALAINKGLAEVGQISLKRNIDNLIVPPLTFYPYDEHKLSFISLYDNAFSGISQSPYRKNLFFSLLPSIF